MHNLLIVDITNHLLSMADAQLLYVRICSIMNHVPNDYTGDLLTEDSRLCFRGAAIKLFDIYDLCIDDVNLQRELACNMNTLYNLTLTDPTRRNIDKTMLRVFANLIEYLGTLDEFKKIREEFDTRIKKSKPSPR